MLNVEDSLKCVKIPYKGKAVAPQDDVFMVLKNPNADDPIKRPARLEDGFIVWDVEDDIFNASGVWAAQGTVEHTPGSFSYTASVYIKSRPNLLSLGSLEPPMDIQNLQLFRVSASWDVEPQSVGYLLRYNEGDSPDWDTAQDLLVGAVPFNAITSPINLVDRTLLVKGVDKFGTESVNPAFIFTPIADPLDPSNTSYPGFNTSVESSATMGAISGALATESSGFNTSVESSATMGAIAGALATESPGFNTNLGI